jgi:hypothetical protein
MDGRAAWPKIRFRIWGTGSRLQSAGLKRTKRAGGNRRNMAEFSMTPFEKAVHAWILKLPGTWTRLDWDKLTQTDDAALDRLVEGGFVQARLPVTLHVKGEAGPINTMWMVSGDYRRGLGAQVKSYLVAHGHEGEGTGTIAGDYEAVRLTRDGELVKQKLEGSATIDHEVLSRASGGPDGQGAVKAPGTVYLQPSRPTAPDVSGPDAMARSTAPVEAKWNMSKSEPITNLPVAAEWERSRRDFDRRASEYPPLTLSILMFEPDRVPPYKEKFDQPNHTVMLWQYIGNTRSGESPALDKPELTAVAVLEGQDTDLFRRMAYRAGSLLPAAMKTQFAEEIMKNVEKRDRPGKPVFAWNDDPLAVWLNFVLSAAAAFQPERLRRVTLPVDPFAISLAAVDLIVSKPKPEVAPPSAKIDTANVSVSETVAAHAGDGANGPAAADVIARDQVSASKPTPAKAGGKSRKRWTRQHCPSCGEHTVEFVSMKAFSKKSGAPSYNTVRARVDAGDYWSNVAGRVPWCPACKERTPEGSGVPGPTGGPTAGIPGTEP